MRHDARGQGPGHEAIVIAFAASCELDDAPRQQLLGRSRDQIGDARRRATEARDRSTDRVMREVDRARRVTGLGPSFPISNYDDLTVDQITSRLDDLTPAELRKVRDYERRHANRKSVLAAVEQKLG